MNKALLILFLCAPWSLIWGASDSPLANQQASIYSRFDLVASSEPVPIADMVTGWGGDYRRGELAYADASFVLGYESKLWSIEREARKYYYASFHKQTSDFYRSLELGHELTDDKKLKLSIKHFDALGVGFKVKSKEIKHFNARLKISARLAIYQVGHFQFADVDGIARTGDVSDASAIIRYRYDDDKLLDANGDPLKDHDHIEKGFGISLTPKIESDFESFRFEIELSDALNTFQWSEGLYTIGCVNVGGGNQARCETENNVSGVSGQAQITESIPYTLSAIITQKNYDISLLGMQHDAYYRIGIEKGIHSSLGRFGFFLYYPHLIGASWQTEYFNIQLGADRFQLSKARNIQLNLGINWHW